jgi:nitronate monooxygenase
VLPVSLGLEHPIIQAPMAGGPTTPELVAAVSQAGALGLIGAAYLTPEQIIDAARSIRRVTDRPFGINLFTGGYQTEVRADAGPMLSILTDVHRMLGISPPAVPQIPPDPLPVQFEAVLEVRPAVFSFTFGLPPAEMIRRARSRGILVAGTATTVEEGSILADAGVDLIVAQGGEAGGHRGTFAGPFETSLVPTLDLVRGICASVRTPVVASGGLMDGRDISAALAAGACAGQLGTAFLACPETGASPAFKQAVLAADRDTTVITRAFSGRPARGLANAFIEMLQGTEEAILPYPLQNMLTRTMRTAAAARGEAGYLSLWAGQGVARSRALPAADLVHTLVAEMR